MSALAELAITMIAGLMELTMHLVWWAISPMRFVISKSYRQQARQRWQANRTKGLIELCGGCVVLLLLAAALAWWWSVFSRPEPSRSEEAKEAWHEMLRAFRDKHR